MARLWYTSGNAHIHLRVYGPLRDTWEFGMLLHERTPLLDRDYYPKYDEGLVYFCIDARAKSWLHKLQHQGRRFSTLHQRITLAPEIMYGTPLIAPFRLRDVPVAPYRGDIGALNLYPTTLERGPLHYYRLVDTPTAEIAQQLAPFFPVYCFAAKTTQLTYVGMSPQRLRHIQPQLQRAFPALAISLRFDLPYESTSEFSPIQRLVHYEPYLSRKGQDASTAFSQVLRTLLPGIQNEQDS